MAESIRINLNIDSGAFDSAIRRRPEKKNALRACWSNKSIGHEGEPTGARVESEIKLFWVIRHHLLL